MTILYLHAYTYIDTKCTHNIYVYILFCLTYVSILGESMEGAGLGAPTWLYAKANSAINQWFLHHLRLMKESIFWEAYEFDDHHHYFFFKKVLIAHELHGLSK